MKELSKHDQKHRNELVSLLEKAQEKAVLTHLYLIANDRDPDAIYAVREAMAHLGSAMESLTGTPEPVFGD